MVGENQNLQLHALIEGRVQGVGFRYFTLKSAKEKNLTGWVRNRRDGRVEVLAEGDQNRLNQLLADLRQGPISSDVEHVEVNFSEAVGEFKDFGVKSTK
jgi:acylphosphatase